jgi:hypothetical protein
MLKIQIFFLKRIRCQTTFFFFFFFLRNNYCSVELLHWKAQYAVSISTGRKNKAQTKGEQPEPAWFTGFFLILCIVLAHQATDIGRP